MYSVIMSSLTNLSNTDRVQSGQLIYGDVIGVLSSGRQQGSRRIDFNGVDPALRLGWSGVTVQRGNLLKMPGVHVVRH